jgi:hypothetical protein
MLSSNRLAEFSLFGCRTLRCWWSSVRGTASSLQPGRPGRPQTIAAVLEVPPDWKLIGYFCLGFPEAEGGVPALQRLRWEERRPAASFLLAGNLAFRDWFARDCPLQRRV